MLELPFIRNNKEQVVEGLKRRNWKSEDLKVVDQILQADDTRKEIQTQLDAQRAELNQLSKEIGQLFKSGKAAEANAAKEKVSSLKSEEKELDEQFKSVNIQLEELLLTVPNVPHPSVPAGNSDTDNEVYKAWAGDLPDLGPDAKPHWDLAKDFQIFDLELGAKIAGAGFPLYRNNGAKLQRALIQFFLDEASKAGYEEIVPPHLVNEATARATGQLPDKEGQMYHAQLDDLYLIPTQEVPVTNIYRDVTVEVDELPVKLTAYTPCFRREAGSYGAHVRGLNRVHQFDKVEIVRIEHPDRSYEALEEMLAHVSGLLEKLELPFRILRLCGGDLGFTSALTFDFEVYSAAQQRWLEVSSVSNFETYQTNRMQLKFKEDKKKRLAHTLNGSALALARIVAALLENNQEGDRIRIPKALQAYTRFEYIEKV
ncbi:MAG: serine--tRNA ligase [Phaeodactylibacter sp.]|nr:serine--tRNA ligase [Phaeodactylibacter sp.]